MTTYIVNLNTIVSHHLHICLLHRRSKVHGLRQARQCTGPFAILDCPCRWTEYFTGVLSETGIDVILQETIKVMVLLLVVVENDWLSKRKY
jgi:hypothetical protein